MHVSRAALPHEANRLLPQARRDRSLCSTADRAIQADDRARQRRRIHPLKHIDPTLPQQDKHTRSMIIVNSICSGVNA